MWCVVADNGDEFWVYGPFDDKDNAEEFAEEYTKLAQKDTPGIEYTVADFYSVGKERI